MARRISVRRKCSCESMSVPGVEAGPKSKSGTGKSVLTLKICGGDKKPGSLNPGVDFPVCELEECSLRAACCSLFRLVRAASLEIAPESAAEATGCVGAAALAGRGGAIQGLR